VLILAKPDPEIFTDIEEVLPFLIEQKGLQIFLEDNLKSYLLERIESSDNTNISNNNSSRSSASKKHLASQIHTFHREDPRKSAVDFVIGFGGDGLLMHCNTLFETTSIPPTMCFDFGSLGFLAPFDFKDFEAEVSYVCCNVPEIAC
jgi:NAD kinase